MKNKNIPSPQLQNQHPSMTTIEKPNIKYKIAILWFLTIPDIPYPQYYTYFTITHVCYICYLYATFLVKILRMQLVVDRMPFFW